MEIHLNKGSLWGSVISSCLKPRPEEIREIRVEPGVYNGAKKVYYIINENFMFQSNVLNLLKSKILRVMTVYPNMY